MEIVPPSPDHIAIAAALLRSGKLVAFPTETVYGLGADATNDKAVAAIFAAKGRPAFDPLIAHVADAREAEDLVAWNDTAQLLATRFWPGPLTLVLPRRPDCPVSLLASAGLDTLAVRVPAHPVALELLRATGRPIAAPSANAFGKLSPTTPRHVAESLGDNVDLILDGGPTSVGVESTVLDLTAPRPTILRPGGLTREQLEEVLGETLGAYPGYAEPEKHERSNSLPLAGRVRKGGAPPDGAVSSKEQSPPPAKSPGMMISHYAPNLPLRLNATEAAFDEALLAFGPDENVNGGALRLNLSSTGNLNEAAANLFAMLRKLDQAHLRGIAVMSIPETGLGAAINDRLKRAAIPSK